MTQFGAEEEEGMPRFSFPPREPTLADRLLGRGFGIDVILILAGVALTSIAAQVATPVGPIQLTGQALAVLLVGMVLGSLRGAVSIALYVLAGGLGLPIFTNSSSGLDTITGPAGGYIFGFIGAAAFVGWVAERGLDRTFLRTVGSAAIGTGIIFLVGVPRLAIVDGLSLSDALVVGVVPVAVGGVIKILIAAAINTAAWAAVERMETQDEKRAARAG